MSTQTPPQTAEPAAPKARKRGRETALDMVRSLAVVMLLVVPVWFLAQPPDSDEAVVRVVDGSGAVSAWTTALPGAPVPAAAPTGWRQTVSYYERDPQALRQGWLTDDDRYVEFAATRGGGEAVAELVGRVPADGVQQVGGAPWQRYVDGDGSVSLVRPYADVTVVVGTRRTDAPLRDLVAVAEGVAPSTS